MYAYMCIQQQREKEGERFRLNMGLTSHRFCMLGDPNVCTFDLIVRFIFDIAGRQSLKSSLQQTWKETCG